MGRKSRHKKARRHSALELSRQLTGLPPTLASVQKLQRNSGQHGGTVDEVLTLHPDFAALDSSQMDFDKAVFDQITGITLLRHPYASEIDLKAVYEEEHGVGSSKGLVLLLDVSSIPHHQGMRTKIPTALGPKDALYKQLSQGYCAIVGEHDRNHLFYGILHQKLPIEVIETGVVPIANLY